VVGISASVNVPLYHKVLMSLVCDESTCEVSHDVTVAGRCIQVDVLGAGALNWRVPAGLFTWNQHERILSVLMQLFCAFHCKVITTRCLLVTHYVCQCLLALPGTRMCLLVLLERQCEGNDVHYPMSKSVDDDSMSSVWFISIMKSGV